VEKNGVLFAEVIPSPVTRFNTEYRLSVGIFLLEISDTTNSFIIIGYYERTMKNKRLNNIQLYMTDTISFKGSLKTTRLAIINITSLKVK
jgi:hypothetical protein